jgi:ankyrin repeat protein
MDPPTTEFLARVHRAIYSSLEAVQTLFPDGLPPECVYQGFLCEAVHSRRVELVQWFLDQGVPADSPDHEGNTPLDWSMAWGPDPINELLIQRGADVNRRTRGDTPFLTYWCFDQRVSMVRLALQHGADPNVDEEGGDTPLHIACSIASIPLVSLLMEWGGDPTRPNHEGLLPEQCIPTNTPPLTYTQLIEELARSSTGLK